MKIVWFTWKDHLNPQSGGAEIVSRQIAKRLIKNGHQLIILTAGFKNSEQEINIDGYKIIRLGNRWTVYWQAYKYFKKNLKNWPDIIIEEVNTIPFFTKLYTKTKKILFFYQLCRQIWFYQLFFPLSLIGYLLEPIYLRLLNKESVFTISQSTKNDLIKHGFSADKISIIKLGIDLQPIENLNNTKFNQPTILSLGSVRPMKRTDHIWQAWKIAKEKIPELQLIIAGDNKNKYGQKLIKLIKQSKYKHDIQILNRINRTEKIQLYQQAHLISVTSVKEGWGLIVTEANSQGTPAIGYNVDGLRDSIKDQQTGLLCNKNNPQNLAECIIKLIQDKKLYQDLQFNAWQQSHKHNFNQTYQDFINILCNYH